MGLFSKKKEQKEEMAMCECGNMCKVSDIEAKKAQKAAEEAKRAKGCCCGGNCSDETMKQAENAKSEGPSVKVLGSGCAKCNQLEAATKEALEQLSIDTAIDHVTDFSKIASYGVMTTPALVVDGKVVSYGKVLKTSEVVEILKKVRG